MLRYIKSEQWKHKRTLYKKLIFIMPAVCVLTVIFLMSGNYVQSTGYNWWYMLFLPFTSIYIAAMLINREKRYNFHGMFTVTEDKKKLWYGKVATGTVMLAQLCAFFWVYMVWCGVFWGSALRTVQNIGASVCLFLTFAWQIPLFMYITLKSNLFFSVTAGVCLNFGMASFAAEGKWWWIPFAIPAKVMCYAVGVRPNGILISETESLCSKKEAFAGILLCILLYAGITFATAKLFEKQEA